MIVVAAGVAANGGPGELAIVDANDPTTPALAERNGGLAGVRFTKGPAHGSDAVSDHYVAHTRSANVTLCQSFHQHAKATFNTSIQDGRIPCPQFDGVPGPGTPKALSRHTERPGIQPAIDVRP